MARLTDRVYIVTGAAGGIGSGIAAALLDEGGRVGLCDLDVSSLKAVTEQMLVTEADVTSEADADRVVEKTVARFGRLDGLVNGAGAIVMGSASDSNQDDWDRQLAVNLTGTFIFSKAVVRHLKEHGGGAIVNVASNCGKVGYRNMAAYNASKAAVINLTRSLAEEWAEVGINVNAVCPGGVDTPMLDKVAEWWAQRLTTTKDELLAGMGPAQLGRRVQPIEVGRVIAFLLSDDAVIIRGQAINVDGGDTPY